MQDINFEKILGENIDSALSLGYATNEIDDNIYLILEPKGQFFGRSLHHIAIGTDPDKSITTIHLSFQGPPDSFFYNRLRKAYGENFDVMVRNNVISDETNTQQEGEFIQTLQKKIISLKKGNINDSNIQFVKWEKEAFEIMFIPAAFTIYFKFF